jgi:hypothetical protein
MVPGVVSHIEFLHEFVGYTAFLRRLSAFARVVTFDKRGQGLDLSEEEMLKRLRKTLSKEGKLSRAVIDATVGLPCNVTYQKHFGSLRETYRLIGYPPSKDHNLQCSCLNGCRGPVGWKYLTSLRCPKWVAGNARGEQMFSAVPPDSGHSAEESTTGSIRSRPRYGLDRVSSSKKSTGLRITVLIRALSKCLSSPCALVRCPTSSPESL